MAGPVSYSAFSRVSQLASLPSVHAAFRWFHLYERKVMQWQSALVSIPAPPFGERARAEWLRQRFLELGLHRVEIDAEGNVLGWTREPGDAPLSSSPSCVVLSAHLDTVFPRSLSIAPVIEDHCLRAPGACDNGAGIAGMLAVAAAIRNCSIEIPGEVMFLGNVGEEGEGDLRGMRYLYNMSPWRERIAAHIVLDGAGSDLVVTQALGSRRYRVTVSGPGGHSWTDAGTPNPIVILSEAIAELSQVKLAPQAGTTWNVGSFEGGTSINSIPEQATASFDLRSLEAEELTRLEEALWTAVEHAVLRANEAARRQQRSREPARFEIVQIGDRPAGRLSPDSILLENLRAADRHLGICTKERAASTDANLPLSLGVPALSLGAGGNGGDAHTRSEWYDSTGREHALKRILLLLLAFW